MAGVKAPAIFILKSRRAWQGCHLTKRDDDMGAFYI